MSTRVAVIIPAYNHERYIAAALDSVLNQSRQADRIIVLDDGSSDNTYSILQEYTSKGIEVSTQSNQGAHHTLNTLVSNAAQDCEIIAILNSDDQWHPQRLESALHDLDKSPNAELWISSLELVDDEDASLKEGSRARWFDAVDSILQEERPLTQKVGLANIAITTSNFVARNSFLSEFPFANYRFVHDYHLLIHAAVRGTLLYNQNNLLSYRSHESNTITTQPRELSSEVLRLFVDIQRFYGKEERLSDQESLRLNQIYHAAADNLSCFDDSIYQDLIRKLFSESTSELEGEHLENLPPERLARFPNRGWANHHVTHDNPVLSAQSGLAIAHEALLSEEKSAKHLAELRHQISRSRWLSMGRLLGLSRAAYLDHGQGASSKLSALQCSLQDSAYIGWGAKLGSRSCRKLLELSNGA